MHIDTHVPATDINSQNLSPGREKYQRLVLKRLDVIYSIT